MLGGGLNKAASKRRQTLRFTWDHFMGYNVFPSSVLIVYVPILDCIPRVLPLVGLQQDRFLLVEYL